MLWTAYTMLVRDRSKYLGIVLALALTTLLVTVQAATLVSVLSRTTAFIDSIGGIDLWVTDPRVEHSDDVRPMLDTEVSRVRGVPGVAWAVGLYKGSIRARLPDGRTVNCQLLGLDSATLIGGPSDFLEGRLADLRLSDAVAVDLAGATGRLAEGTAGGRLRTGDVLELNDNRALVTGIFRGVPNFQSLPVIVTTYDRARVLVPSERKLLSFILVRLKPGADPAAVAAHIAESTGLRARTTAEFSAGSLRWFIRNTGILLNFGLVTALAFLIGSGIAAQTFFSFTVDNQRHFAVLRAMGARGRTLVGMVLLQAGFACLLGYGLGMGGAALLAGASSGEGPVGLKLVWQLMAGAAVAIVLVGLLAAGLGLRRVFRLDPAMVFK
jgi:putative ABC transport system permease protein